MQDTSTPRRRGRIPTGRARTVAQRAQARRERAATLVFEGGPVGEVPDSTLLDAVSIAYRAGLRVEVKRIAGELLRRLDQDKAVAVTS